MIDHHRLVRLERLALLLPRLERIDRPQLRIDAERERGALRARGRVGEDAEAAREALDVVEQQRRTLRRPGRDLGDAAELEMRIGAGDATQRSELVDLRDELAKSR